MADVNGDGYVDIYVSGVDYLTMHGRNVLYVNNGDGTFTDRTKEYGLDHVGLLDAGRSSSTMTATATSTCSCSTTRRTASARPMARRSASDRAIRARSDRLFRNDGGHFVDVSDAAGIRRHAGAFGLGVVASDFNPTAVPTSTSPTISRRTTTCTSTTATARSPNRSRKATGHTSRFSMGVDAADFNNDGRPDIFVADMLPDREDILKTSASTESFDSSTCSSAPAITRSTSATRCS